MLIGELMKFAKAEAYFRFVTFFFQNQYFIVGTILKNKDLAHVTEYA